jgi:hypothetical protein
MIPISEVSFVAEAHGAPVIALFEAPAEKRKELTGSQLSLDLWQNFMTGNYYYCFACQAACPVGRPYRA